MASMMIGDDDVLMNVMVMTMMTEGMSLHERA